ncbi:hypothetical protein GCM10020000_70770 [Streptomyces olivoverticillatus]
MRAALDDAGIGGHEVGHVNAHGTSTPVNDLVEARVIRRVFGDGPLVTSTKGVTGHLFGAGGAVEAALSVLAVERGVVPPTANLTALEPEIDLRVAREPSPVTPRIAVSNSAGFGGQNAALVVAAA